MQLGGVNSKKTHCKYCVYFLLLFITEATYWLLTCLPILVAF